MSSALRENIPGPDAARDVSGHLTPCQSILRPNPEAVRCPTRCLQCCIWREISALSPSVHRGLRGPLARPWLCCIAVAASWGSRMRVLQELHMIIPSSRRRSDASKRAVLERLGMHARAQPRRPHRVPERHMGVPRGDLTHPDDVIQVTCRPWDGALFCICMDGAHADVCRLQHEGLWAR